MHRGLFYFSQQRTEEKQDKSETKMKSQEKKKEAQKL